METSAVQLSIVKFRVSEPLSTTGTTKVPCSRFRAIVSAGTGVVEAAASTAVSTAKGSYLQWSGISRHFDCNRGETVHPGEDPKNNTRERAVKRVPLNDWHLMD